MIGKQLPYTLVQIQSAYQILIRMNIMINNLALFNSQRISNMWDTAQNSKLQNNKKLNKSNRKMMFMLRIINKMQIRSMNQKIKRRNKQLRRDPKKRKRSQIKRTIKKIKEGTRIMKEHQMIKLTLKCKNHWVIFYQQWILEAKFDLI